jgi:hypothetical protein
MSPRRRIVLFSPFPPNIGGGSVVLKSLIPQLEEFDISWLYTAPRDQQFSGATWIGPGLGGGLPWHDLSRAALLWSRVETPRLDHLAQELMSQPADGHWIVAHNEGTLVARVLMHRGARVHLTVQDDVPDGIFGRSTRYRLLAPLARPTYQQTLKLARSVDVISEGMRRYYASRLGLKSVVVHRFISQLPATTPPPPRVNQIEVGHIGSIYAAEEWRAFLAALRGYARRRGLAARMIMVGMAERYRTDAGEFSDMVELIPDTPEAEAVQRLSRCDFVYAMYPFKRRADVFRRTSLPTKMSTYLLCQRPILGHAPAASSLADVLRAHDLGVLCPSSTPAALDAAIEIIAAKTVPRDKYEAARGALFGTQNVIRLANCLAALSAVQAPEMQTI